MIDVIIIGGGFAGANTAKQLQKNKQFKVTLIDSKDYFEFTPSILRLIPNPNKLNEIRVKHKDYLKKTKAIIGKVNKINDKFVYINNKKINYDYLIIATGSSYVLPFDSKTIVNASSSKDLIENRKNFLKAKSIGIIGGGLVGVELAGEIVENFPDKKLTIIESGPNLMARNTKRCINLATKMLTKNNVKFYLNQKAISYKNKTINTDKGEKIHLDLVFLATGVKPNSKAFKGFLDITEKGYINVDNNLQTNKKNIFALGDVNDIREEKTAQAAGKQASIVVKNIMKLENKQALTTYHSKKRPLLISLGKYNAILEYKSLVISGKIPALIKYFVELKTIMKFKI